MNIIKKDKVILSLLIVAVVFNLTAIIWNVYFCKQKVAYIRSTELVYGYLGMQDAHNKLTKQEDSWKGNIDTIKADYEKALSKYRSELTMLTEKEKIEREKNLLAQKQSLENYQIALNKKIQEEDSKLTQGVLNQINAFVEDYGKKKGYDIIMGTTSSGSLMYAKSDMDITKQVLYALNENYRGETK